MASERYASLPPKSDAAGKALLAVALTKGIFEVRLHENIRRKRQHSDSPSLWFDFIVDSMLKAPTPRFKPFLDRCANASLPPTFAHDFAPPPSNARQATTAKLQLIFFDRKSEKRPPLRPKHALPTGQTASNPNPSSVVNIDLINLADTVQQTRPKPLVSSQPAKPRNTEVVLLDSPLTQVLHPASAQPLQQPCAAPPPPNLQLSVFLVFDDQTNKVSIDIDLLPVKPPAPTAAPQPFARIAHSSSYHPSNVTSANLTASQPIEHKHVTAQSNILPNLARTDQTAPPATALDLPTVPETAEPSLAVTQPDGMQRAYPSSATLPAPSRPPPAPPVDIYETELAMVTGESIVPTIAPPSPPARIRRKRPNLPLPRQTTGYAKIARRRKHVRERLTAALQPEPNQRTPTLQAQHRRSTRLSSSDTPLKRPIRRARPVAPLLDVSDSGEDDGHDSHDELDQDFDVVIEAEASRPREHESNQPPVEELAHEARENGASKASFQRQKQVRFSDTVQEMNTPAPTENKHGIQGRMKRKRTTVEPPQPEEQTIPDDEEEVLDSNDAVISRQKIFTRAGNRRQPSRSHGPAHLRPRKPIPRKSSPLGDNIREPSPRSEPKDEAQSSTRRFSRLVTEPKPGLWKKGLEELERGIRAAQHDEYSLSASDSDEDITWSRRLLVLRHTKMRVDKGQLALEELRLISEEEEAARCRDELEHTHDYGSTVASPAVKFFEEMYRKGRKGQSKRLVRYDSDEDLEEENEYEDEKHGDSEGDDEQASGPRRVRRDNAGSSDSQESSGGDGIEEDERLEGEMDNPPGPSRHEARTLARQARELQKRVCGDLLPTMTSEASRRVLRWAEKDFTWFEPDSDFMEITAARSSKPCGRCTVSSDKSEMCEESILLKLFKDMTWRKVRRMRHRDQRKHRPVRSVPRVVYYDTH